MLVLEHSTTEAERQVAARMRAIATKAGADHLLAERAVAEALAIWQRTDDVDVALNTGLAFVDAVKAERRAEQNEPFTWVETWPFVLVGAIVVGAVLVGRAFGWLP